MVPLRLKGSFGDSLQGIPQVLGFMQGFPQHVLQALFQGSWKASNYRGQLRCFRVAGLGLGYSQTCRPCFGLFSLASWFFGFWAFWPLDFLQLSCLVRLVGFLVSLASWLFGLSTCWPLDFFMLRVLYYTMLNKTIFIHTHIYIVVLSFSILYLILPYYVISYEVVSYCITVQYMVFYDMIFNYIISYYFI